MINIKSKNREVNIPDTWEELSPGQFVKTVTLIHDLFAGKFDLIDFRLKLLAVVSGYKRSRRYVKYSDEQKEIIDSNVHALADLLRFPLKPWYPEPDVLDILSKDCRNLLQEVFPFEIYNPDMLAEIEMLGNMLKYSYAVNYNLKENPLPYIDINNKRLTGPRFNIDENNLAETDIMAQEFVDAVEYYTLYNKSKNEAYINKLVSVLYRENRYCYDPVKVAERARLMEKTNTETKKAVVFVFQNILEYLNITQPYTYLFSKEKVSPDEKRRDVLGIANTIYSLSKEGFGDVEKIGRMNLAYYLNLRIKQLQDTIQSLRAMEKNNNEIAKTLELPIETVIAL